MDYKKSKAPVNTVTRNIMDLCDETDNIYESVAIIGKRANQISIEIKQDLSKKLAEFASYNDSLEEVFENREQIEISRYYEKLPKPRNSLRERFIGATHQKTTTKYDTAQTVRFPLGSGYSDDCMLVSSHRSISSQESWSGYGNV